MCQIILSLPYSSAISSISKITNSFSCIFEAGITKRVFCLLTWDQSTSFEVPQATHQGTLQMTNEICLWQVLFPFIICHKFSSVKLLLLWHLQGIISPGGILKRSRIRKELGKPSKLGILLQCSWYWWPVWWTKTGRRKAINILYQTQVTANVTHLLLQRLIYKSHACFKHGLISRHPITFSDRLIKWLSWGVPSTTSPNHLHFLFYPKITLSDWFFSKQNDKNAMKSSCFLEFHLEFLYELPNLLSLSSFAHQRHCSNTISSLQTNIRSMSTHCRHSQTQREQQLTKQRENTIPIHILNERTTIP